MSESEAASSHTSDVLRDLLGEIETLRITRQRQVRDRSHPRLTTSLRTSWELTAQVKNAILMSQP